MFTFAKHLEMIHSFVCRGDGYDALRGIACGLEFGAGSFLINTRSLKKLMCRSKSCLNGCFQRLGYTVCRPSRDLPSLFAEILPGTGAQLCTARQWCVRKAGDSVQVAFPPTTKVDFAGCFPSELGAPPVQETRAERREEIAPAFLFDIQNLLNHPAQVIPRMALDLPPLHT
jgi:hypothetical protein